MNGSGLKRAQTALALLVLVIGTATCRDAPSPTASLARPSFIINGQPTGENSFSNVGALLFDFDGNGIITGDDALCSRSEEHTSELQSRPHLVCRLLLEKKKKRLKAYRTHDKSWCIGLFQVSRTA